MLRKHIHLFVWLVFAILLVCLMAVLVKQENKDRQYCENKNMIYYQAIGSRAVCLSGTEINHLSRK